MSFFEWLSKNSQHHHASMRGTTLSIAPADTSVETLRADDQTECRLVGRVRLIIRVP